MKSILIISLSLPLFSWGQNLKLEDFNYELNDLKDRRLSKERLFNQMNRDLVRTSNSICSNRAHVWAWDFKRNHNLDTAKIFLFYTKRNGDQGSITWWYHVAPVINDNSHLWVMDAGFSFIKSPLTTSDWLNAFAGTSNCKELKAHETDLVKRIYLAQTFPTTTSYGTYQCYYKIVPAGYWTPNMIPKGLLGVDENDQPIQFDRNEIHLNEVFEACTEVATSPIGRVLRSGHKACRKHLGISSQSLETNL